MTFISIYNDITGAPSSSIRYINRKYETALTLCMCSWRWQPCMKNDIPDVMFMLLLATNALFAIYEDSKKAAPNGTKKKSDSLCALIAD